MIWAPFVPLIPFGYCSQSIDGHDLISRSSTIAKCWKVLPRVAGAAGDVEERLAAVGLVVRDLAELVRALVRELHRHDRLARRRVEVLAGTGELEVVASHLRHRRHAVRGLELAVAHEIEEVAGRVLDADARADDLADAACEHDRLRRHAEDLPALRQLALLAGRRDDLALEQLVLLGHRAGALLLLVVEEVPGLARAPPRRGPAGRRAARRATRSRPGSSGRRSRARTRFASRS